MHKTELFKLVFGERKKMKYKIRMCAIATVTFLSVLILLAATPLASAAGAITLTPPMQDPGLDVTVDGTDFGSEKPVGIGLGAEVNVTEEAHQITNLVTDPIWVEDLGAEFYGPFGGNTSHAPIKPGSVYIFYDVDGTTSEYFDNGNGTLWTESFFARDPRVNYATGEFGRRSDADWSGFSDPWAYITYTYYTHNVTPAAGVNTTAAGAFSASITVPTDIDGDLTLTVVDTVGNIATSNLTVVPEGLTIGVMLVLSTVAVIVSIRYFRKRPRTERYSSMKL